jgi:hypothetical protein
VAVFIHENRPGRWASDYVSLNDIEIFDGDGDGKPEILVSTDQEILEWETDHFERTWSVHDVDPFDAEAELGGGGLGRLTHGDFDGDGRMEFILPALGPSGAAGVNVEARTYYARVFENTGDDEYELVARLPVGITGNMQFVNSGDVDGDGIPEFLIGGSPGACQRFELWTATGNNLYERIWAYDGYNPRDYPTDQGATAFGDLDGDGDDELVINLGQAVMALEWSNGEFRRTFHHPVCQACNWSPVWTGDVDGDGADELMFRVARDEDTRAGLILHPDGVMVFRRR